MLPSALLEEPATQKRLPGSGHTAGKGRLGHPRSVLFLPVGASCTLNKFSHSANQPLLRMAGLGTQAGRWPQVTSPVRPY